MIRLTKRLYRLIKAARSNKAPRIRSLLKRLEKKKEVVEKEEKKAKEERQE